MQTNGTPPDYTLQQIYKTLDEAHDGLDSTTRTAALLLHCPSFDTLSLYERTHSFILACLSLYQ